MARRPGAPMNVMTALPDPAELAPSRDAAYGRPRLMTRGFWLMMAFGLVCLVAAAVVGVFGSHLFRARPAPGPVAADLARGLPSQTSLAPPPASAAVAVIAPSGQESAVEARLQRLEAGQSRALAAASEALAAAALSDAAAQPRPFGVTLASVQRVLPASTNTASLQALAAQGAPTEAALAVDLAAIAAHVSVEARAPSKGASILDQISYAVSRVVSVRRLDAGSGGPDGALARAERAANDGDLAGALATLDAGLPPSAKAAFGPWREQALRRIAIDEAISALRRQAVSDLAAAQAGRP